MRQTRQRQVKELVLAITMTEKAADHVRQQLVQRGSGLGIRVGVKTTGCSGMAYVLEFVDESDADDQVFENHGVRLFVDPKSLVYIDGTEMDFVKEGLNEGFEFTNPNSAGECGCGEGFTV